MRTIACTLAPIALLFLGGCGSATPSAPSLATTNVASASRSIADTGPHAAGITVVIMENRDYDLIIGSKNAPYINGTLVPQAALLTNSHAIGHPSQPNYLALFSGSTQGITDDSCPHTFSTENLGAEVLAAGNSFIGYSESMPKDGYTGCTYGNLYARKHNPWVNFTNVPASSNLIYYDQGLRDLPASPFFVYFIVPNLCNDMHDCSTQTGDNWLKANLPPILQQDATRNGLLILTWDEADPDANGKNQIATLLIGPMIVPGKYSQHVTHYNVLHTMEKIAKVTCVANSCTAPVLKGMWQ